MDTPAPTTPKIQINYSLLHVAYILQLVVTIVTGLVIFPLIWNLPILLTIKSHLVGSKKNKDVLALGIVSLFFSFIVALIILCSRASVTGYVSLEEMPSHPQPANKPNPK